MVTSLAATAKGENKGNLIKNLADLESSLVKMKNFRIIIRFDYYPARIWVSGSVLPSTIHRRGWIYLYFHSHLSTVIWNSRQPLITERCSLRNGFRKMLLSEWRRAVTEIFDWNADLMKTKQLSCRIFICDCGSRAEVFITRDLDWNGAFWIRRTSLLLTYSFISPGIRILIKNFPVKQIISEIHSIEAATKVMLERRI